MYMKESLEISSSNKRGHNELTLLWSFPPQNKQSESNRAVLTIRSRTKCFLQPVIFLKPPSFPFHHSFRQHVYTRGKAICCSRKSLCRTRLQEPYLCGVFLPQTGRHSVSKELTNQQRQIYINNCWVEWRGVAHHSEQERGQYLLEFESHPSLRDFNLRCLGLWLMIVWEQGEALPERSAGLYRVLAGWGENCRFTRELRKSLAGLYLCTKKEN